MESFFSLGIHFNYEDAHSTFKEATRTFDYLRTVPNSLHGAASRGVILVICFDGRHARIDALMKAHSEFGGGV